MNAFLKNCLKVAGLAILLGFILAIAGFGMDNSVFREDNFHFGPISIKSNDAKVELTDFTKDNGLIEDNNNIDGNQTSREYNESIEATEANGDLTFTIDKDQTVYSGTFIDVKSIDLDISYGSITIQEGNNFSIQAIDISDEHFDSKVKNNGEWVIEYKKNYNLVDFDDYNGDSNYSNNYSHKISILGVEINVGGNNSNTIFNSPEFIITIPSDFEAEELNIRLGAGTLKVKDELKASDAMIDIGAGSGRISNIIATNKSSFTVGTGELVIDYIESKDVIIDCGVGNLEASGKITGDSSVTCGIGNVDLKIEGDETNYNYSVDCGIGTVIINNNRYSGVNSKNTKYDGANNRFTLDCGIGKISLKIK
jgi:hypothetical protein